jgi:hypothetical protein
MVQGQDSGFGIWDLEFKFESLGLGFEVWGLEFRV